MCAAGVDCSVDTHAGARNLKFVCYSSAAGRRARHAFRAGRWQRLHGAPELERAVGCERVGGQSTQLAFTLCCCSGWFTFDGRMVSGPESPPSITATACTPSQGNDDAAAQRCAPSWGA